MADEARPSRPPEPPAGGVGPGGAESVARPGTGTDPGGSCPALVGPTAAGKTALVVALAARFPIEVIGLDSRQVYRGLRIGAAQPGPRELAACPHHLVDFLPVDEPYSAARYRRDFAAAWRGIRARGRIPLLVGGAGLYLKALREGLLDLPGAGQEETARLRRELDGLADEEVRHRLRERDPISWRRIHPRDRYRSQRALEICLLTGRPMSELIVEQQPRPVLGLRFPTFVLVRPTPELDARIRARARAMLAGGWLEETAALLERHGPDAPGLRSVGYREVVAHLRGDLPRAELEEAVVRSTRQLAKRQRTWFRHARHLAVGHPDDPATLAVLERLIAEAGDGVGGATAGPGAGGGGGEPGGAEPA